MFSRKNIPYGNWKVLNINGDLIFRCSQKKINWYLERGLADKVEDGTIRLNFVTNGDGHKGDDFYLKEKQNRCVRCGEKEIKLISKHHVIPQMFRRHMDDRIKGRSHHDIVLLCKKCHREYESVAEVLKEQLYQQHGLASQKSSRFVSDPEGSKIRGLARAIVRHGSKMPVAKLNELKDKIEQLIDGPLTAEKLTELISSSPERVADQSYIDLGKWVVEHTEDLQAFAIMWREHFLNSMKPELMPEGWNKEKSILRVDLGG